MDGCMDGKPRCAECGHTMCRYRLGWGCAENTCSLGLAGLGDFRSADRVARRRGKHVL